LTQAAQDNSKAGNPSGRFYNPALDGLRFVAFLGVFFHHMVQGDPEKYAAVRFLPHVLLTWIPTAARSFGGAAVDLFFVLSAYLITTLLTLEKERTGRIDVLAFYIRRALRIWPLYFAVLLALLLSRQYWKPHVSLSYFLASALFLGNWALAFYRDGSPGPMTPLWSVSMEEQYYAVWPWVVARFGPRTLARIGWAIVTASVAFRFCLWLTVSSYNEMSAITFARMAPIGLGVILAVDGRFTACFQRLRFPLLWIAVSVAAIVALERPTAFGEIPSLYTAVVKVPATAVVCMLMVGVLVREDCARIPVLSSPMLVYLGRISYGLYLIHALAMEVVYRYLPHLVPGNKVLRGMLAMPSVLALTIIAAAISFRFFEQPFLSLKGRFAKVQSGAGG
jgi:peptidoglycan/LPS O-acetylase OafA/YrhL